MERLFDRMIVPAADRSGGSLAVDVAERDDEIVVTVDLPGFEPEEIDLTVADGVFTVAAEHTTEREDVGTDADDGGVTYLHRERRTESVSRRVPLPADVNESDTRASYTNGVLSVSLPKRIPDRLDVGRRIDVE